MVLVSLLQRSDEHIARSSRSRTSNLGAGGLAGGLLLFGSDDGDADGPLTLHDALAQRGIPPSSFRGGTSSSASIANKSIFQSGAKLWHNELVRVSNAVKPQSSFFGPRSTTPSYYTGQMPVSRMESSNASVKKKARCAVSGAPEWWSREAANTNAAIYRASGYIGSPSAGPSGRFTEEEMGDNLYVPRKTISNADYSRRYETSRNDYLLGRSMVNTRPSTNLGSSIRNYGLGERPAAPVETDDWSAQYKICLERHADSEQRRLAASLRFPITSLPPLPVVEQEIILPGQWGEYGSEEEEEAGTESGGPSIFSSLWSGVRDSLRPGPRPTEEGSGAEGETAERSTWMPGQWDFEDDNGGDSEPPPSDPPEPPRRRRRSYHPRTRRTGTSYRPSRGRPSTPGTGRRWVERSVASSWESEMDEETIQNSPTPSQGSNADLYN